MSISTPRFAETFCSQCGAAFGPGDHGFSHCIDHKPKPDPREADYSREGIFVNHNCAYCRDGELPCKQGHPSRCDNPRARND